MQSSRLRLCRGELGVRKWRKYRRDGGILQFGEELYESLAEGGHDIGGVVLRETANQADGGDAVLKDLIIEGDEDRADVFCLCEVFVEAFVQGGKDSLPDGWIWTVRSGRTTSSRMLRSPGSAIPTVSNLSSTSLMISIA